MITREEILQSEETAKLVAEWVNTAFYNPQIEWQQFVETKLNEGKFKTEDNVFVEIHSVIYGVNCRTWITQNATTDTIKFYLPERYKWFSTEAARQTWIEDNEPCLSQSEVMEVYRKFNNNYYPRKVPFADIISDLVKSKQ